MTLEAAGALIGIATAILGGLRWLIRAQVSMLREFKPNGGQSARDQWNRTVDILLPATSSSRRPGKASR